MRLRTLPLRVATTTVACLAVLAAGCSADGDGGAADRSSATPTRDGDHRDASPSASPRPAPAKGSVTVVDTVAEGLDSPWGLAPLPGGDLLVASRDTGVISRVDAEDGTVTEVGVVPGVAPGGEGGLLGIAVPPTFGADHYVYAYLTTASDNRIVRMVYDEQRAEGEQLTAPDTVFRGIPKGTVHNGGRIAFGPDRMLYVGTGEAGDRGLSQDRTSLGSKILRMTPDGEPAGHGNPDSDSVVYSRGHRNVQGLAWDAEQRLWATEFGQDTWDEVNLIRPDGNYGWPEVEGKADERGFVDPVVQWKPAEASPSGLAYAKGCLWVAGLRGERLWRIPLDGARPAAKPQAFLVGEYGRLRTVVSDGGDGLWLVTSNTDGRGDPDDKDDRVLRLRVR